MKDLLKRVLKADAVQTAIEKGKDVAEASMAAIEEQASRAKKAIEEALPSSAASEAEEPSIPQASEAHADGSDPSYTDGDIDRSERASRATSQEAISSRKSAMKGPLDPYMGQRKAHHTAPLAEWERLKGFEDWYHTTGKPLSDWYHSTGKHISEWYERTGKALNDKYTRLAEDHKQLREQNQHLLDRNKILITEQRRLERELDTSSRKVAASRDAHESTSLLEERMRLGSAFSLWCRDGTVLVNRLRQFERALEARGHAFELRLARREGDRYRLLKEDVPSDLPPYWVVESEQHAFLVPQPSSALRFWETDGFSGDVSIAPKEVSMFTPAVLTRTTAGFQVETPGWILR